MTPVLLNKVNAPYPARLRERLGDLGFLAMPKTALFCSARALPQRIPAEWQPPLADGRLHILSGFGATEKRVTTELATRRNVLVAALADEIYVAYATVGGHIEQLEKRAAMWKQSDNKGSVLS